MLTASITVIPASPDHIPHLAANLREADRRELMFSHGHAPEEALRLSLFRSEAAWTLMMENAGFSPQAASGRFFPQGEGPKSPSPVGKKRPSLPEAKLPHFLPAAMGGVSPAGSVLSLTGRPWLLATPAFEAAPRTLIARLSRRYVGTMARLFPRLENWCHADNALALRWLAWCGFSLDAEPRPFGLAGEPFYRFFKE